MRREAAGLEILDLTGSNPTQAGIDYPEDLLKKLSSPESMRYNPSPQGYLPARKAIANWYSRSGRAVSPDDLLLTASTSEAYAYLFKLLCDPGDEILIPTPTYPLFDSLAELEHIELIRYPLLPMEDSSAHPIARWKPDFDFLRSIISTRSKAIILVHPNNPTGHLTTTEDLSVYLEIAAEYGLSLIVDEVFSEYLLADGKHSPLTSSGPLVFTLNGLSKMLGLPQVKLGWIHLSGNRATVDEALSHLEWIADAYLSVNTPVQVACEELLEHGATIRAAILGRLKTNLDFCLANCSGWATLRRPEAGWYAVLEVDATLPISHGSGRTDDAGESVHAHHHQYRRLDASLDETFAEDLVAKTGVYVLPGSLFGFTEGCPIVLSLLTPIVDFQKGFRKLAAFAGEAYG